jgi:hypothetical protein
MGVEPRKDGTAIRCRQALTLFDHTLASALQLRKGTEHVSQGPMRN